MLLSYLPAFAVIFAVSLLCSAALAPVSYWLGLRLSLVDRPGGRRQHGRIVSRLGGIALYGGFTLAVLLTLVLPVTWLPPRLDPNEMFRLTGLLLGTAAVFIFGLQDDRFHFGSRPQYLAQFLSAFIAVAFIIFIERVNNPLDRLTLSGFLPTVKLPPQIIFPLPVVAALTIFWFMGMMNTVNWLDGLDGLATGVSAIFATVLAIHMLREGQFSVALLPIALVGATLGFLPFNFNPARVFMGSSGSYFLGWALAALGIIGGAKVATVLLVMSLPILDVAWLIIYRWRHGHRPSQDGRDHLHYRLLDMGYSQRQIVAGYYIFCAVAGVLALGLGSRLFKLVALLLLAGAALAVIVWASRQTPKEVAMREEPNKFGSPL
jgi:UDP-GlcNAc:undecaprenyl-phosphate/decaprenyl-phosphate GlcNAc-1-phosphate transferase